MSVDFVNTTLAALTDSVGPTLISSRRSPGRRPPPAAPRNAARSYLLVAAQIGTESEAGYNIMLASSVETECGQSGRG